MPQLTPSQLSILNDRFAPSGGGIPGTWLQPGTVPATALVQSELREALRAILGTPLEDHLTAAAAASSFTLDRIPIGMVQVLFEPAAGALTVWVEDADFIRRDKTLIFDPLAAGDKVHVYYRG
jgi:hypothetical protein